VSSNAVLQIGQQAATLCAKQLSRPFTVVTRWQHCPGPQQVAPVLCLYPKDNGQDLNQSAGQPGLARVFGVRAISPDGTAPETSRAALLALEDTARHEKLGAWVTSSPTERGRSPGRSHEGRYARHHDPAHGQHLQPPDLPRRRLGEILRDTHVHLLEEYSDGYVRIAHEVNGADQEVMCLRWELGLPELPAAPAALRVEQPETVAVN
jgi:hypothetical protein